MISYRKFSSKRKFGVELEMEKTLTQQEIETAIRSVDAKREVRITSWAQSGGNQYWHVKYDSTCGPKGYKKDQGGWEVASFVASGHKDVVLISKVADAIAAKGATINKNCGVHVHVDMADFDTAQAAILTARWFKMEPILPQILPGHRVNNKYCRFLSNVKKGKFNKRQTYTASEFWNITRPTNLNVHENKQKKVSLNLVHYRTAMEHYSDCSKQTVEFRFPEGTLSGNDIKNWVRIFVNFVDLSLNAKMPKNLSCVRKVEKKVDLVLSSFGLLPNNEDDFYILSKGLYQAKVWLLARFVRFGAPAFVEEARKRLDQMATRNA